MTERGGAYVGGAERGFRDGCGVELLANGALLEGCFVGDRLDGLATLAVPGRGYFRGEWRNGVLARRVPIDLEAWRN